MVTSYRLLVNAALRFG